MLTVLRVAPRRWNIRSVRVGGHRGGRSGDSWVPSYMQGYMPSTLARLLCCKSVVYTELES